MKARDPDPTIRLTLSSEIAELGSAFDGRLVRQPRLEDGQKPDAHKLAGVCLEFGYATEGRGSVDKKFIRTREFPVDEWGRLDTAVTAEVPSSAPISYDGQLIRVRWFFVVTAVVKRARDQALEVPVLVVPKDGLDLYELPHPLPADWMPPQSFEPPPLQGR